MKKLTIILILATLLMVGCANIEVDDFTSEVSDITFSGGFQGVGGMISSGIYYTVYFTDNHTVTPSKTIMKSSDVPVQIGKVYHVTVTRDPWNNNLLARFIEVE